MNIDARLSSYVVRWEATDMDSNATDDITIDPLQMKCCLKTMLEPDFAITDHGEQEFTSADVCSVVFVICHDDDPCIFELVLVQVACYNARMSKWPKWRLVAGPTLTTTEFHFATLSDRDFETGQSFVENTEARNLQTLMAARKGQKQPKETT
jgi:hypothetical protein